jgi:hypothetical protein
LNTIDHCCQLVNESIDLLGSVRQVPVLSVHGVAFSARTMRTEYVNATDDEGASRPRPRTYP